MTVVVDDQVFEDHQAMEKLTFLVREEEADDTVYLSAEHLSRDTAERTEGMEPVWEIHGWSHTHEFLDRIPLPKDEKKYVILVQHHDKAICEALSYPLFLIGALLMKGHGAAAEMDCYVDHSSDGKNHVALMRRTASA